MGLTGQPGGTPPKIRSPHIVSAGYQRLFSADQKRIRVISKVNLRAGLCDGKMIGVKDNFKARKHFLRIIVDGIATDEVEDEFARLEDWSVPRLRTIRFDEALTNEQDSAVKIMMAIHWARSYAHEEVRQRLRPKVYAEAIASIPSDLPLQRRFVRQYGRPAQPGELEDLLDQARRAIEHERAHDVQSIIRAHNFAVEKFEHSQLQMLRPASRAVHFLTGDSPTLIASDTRLLNVGGQRLALGDAGFVMMPLSPWLAACLASESGHVVLDNGSMFRLNRAMVTNCLSRIACHDSTDVARALGG